MVMLETWRIVAMVTWLALGAWSWRLVLAG
jgi:hypothetical protein